MNGATRVRHAVLSFSWASIDQVLFALSNLVITLAVARGAGAEGLGRYAVAFAVYLVVLGISRSLLADPLLASPLPGDREADGSAAALAVLFAAGSAVPVALSGIVLDRPELIVVAVTLPITLLHDCARYLAFHRGAPALAALLDGGWLLGSLLAWPLLTRPHSPSVAVAAWAGGALLGLLLTWPALRTPVARPSAAFAWWRRDARRLAMPLVVDSLIVAASTQAVVIGVAALVGDEALGVLRAAQVYFAPMGLGLTAIGVLLVPRLAQSRTGPTNGIAFRLLSGVALLTAVAGALILLAAPLLHTLLYAGSITVPRSLLLPLAVQGVFVGASSALMIVCKARRRGNDIVRSRLPSAVGGTVILLFAVGAFGVVGAAWALALQTAWYTVELAVRVMRAGKVSTLQPRVGVPADA